MPIETAVNIAPNPPLTLETIREDVERYWGQLKPIDFLVSCELIKRIRDRAPLSGANNDIKHIALKIVNYQNPLKISFDWIKYSTLNQPNNSATTLYCVLDSATVDYLTRPLGDDFNAVNARIAKDSANAIYVYFHRAKVVNKGDGSGGDGNTMGVKLPSN
jgi:hypothetical protein